MESDTGAIIPIRRIGDQRGRAAVYFPNLIDAALASLSIVDTCFDDQVSLIGREENVAGSAQRKELDRMKRDC